MKLKVIILLISLLSGSIEAQTIHYNAFSHNDYERSCPLFDALSFQFNCVEADLWLIDGELYVSHDSVAPNPDITFEKLYLLPLVERIKKNGGKVYPGSDRPVLPDGRLQDRRRSDVPRLEKETGAIRISFLS